jgi:hypothetical protein
LAFYNPVNTLRALANFRKDSLGRKRLLFQVIGQIGLLMTTPKLFSWARSLKRGPIDAYDGLCRARIPMIDATSGNEINWAIEHIPSLDAQQILSPIPVHTVGTAVATAT